MSSISIIRSLIQDQPILVQETLALDGAQLSRRMTYWPLVGSTVVITSLSAPSSIDQQSGLLTWTVAPAVGSYLFQYATVNLLDSTIQDFIDLQVSDGNDANDTDALRLAAADALDAIASSQALVQKKIMLLDLKTDGPAVADALRAHATTLRELVFNGRDSEPAFDIIEQINDLAGYREKILKDAFRGEW